MDHNTYKKEISSQSAGLPLWTPLQASRSFIENVKKGEFMQYMPKVLYITLLCLVYIGNRHYMDRTIRYIDKLKLEVQDLRAEYMHAQSNYVLDLRRKKIVARAKALHLYESSTPPEVVVLKRR